MSHNTGKRYILCKECGRKRYCKIIPSGYRWMKSTCSQGHSWEWKTGIESEVAKLELERVAAKLLALFERDDIFFASLKRR